MLTTAPILTGDITEPISTSATWIWLAISVAVLGIAIADLTITERIRRRRRKPTSSAIVHWWIGLNGVLFIVAFVSTVFSTINLFDPVKTDDRQIHAQAIEQAVTNTYDINTLQGVDDLVEVKKNPFGTQGPDELLDQLCTEVSPDSPELTGVTKGQQISFKVGVPDCRAERPSAQIIITKTPGQAISARDLEKH